MKSVILVTGAGSGIGKLSALALAEAGHIVYATMRDVEGRNLGRAEELRTVSRSRGIALIPLELDVLSQDSADAATLARANGQLGFLIDLVDGADAPIPGGTAAAYCTLRSQALAALGTTATRNLECSH